VTETAKSYRATFKALFWAAFWSTVLTTFIILAIEAHNKCFVLVNSRNRILGAEVLIWFWLFLFFLSESNRRRLILLVATVLLLMLQGNVDRFPQVGGESEALWHLRGLADALQSYRRVHPSEGYPQCLPKLSSTEKTQMLYKVDFTTSRSKPEGPIDGFFIQATTYQRDCGFLRSFAIGDNGQMYYTFEMRAATKADPKIQ
jgi:hypothetical protein